MDSAKIENETQRGRIRSALVEGLGFRFPKGTPEDEARKRLNRICDDLAYLSDEGIRRVVGALRTKGEGGSRCFWPDRATFLAYAELAESRPLEEAPGVASWFASAAGREAVAEDRLVAEFLFWEKKKKPPLLAGEKRAVAEQAAAFRSQARRARANKACGRPPVLDDQEFLVWYEDLERRATALVEAGRRGTAI
ncbi:hypothetical protein J4E08_22250 [Sagittula sp. NFXS13]|uniref:hypothetical protein n=1 Tax=Sagittula sp. NFXS13 TaxID=2819095 RepID=UPI0032DFBB4A